MKKLAIISIAILGIFASCFAGNILAQQSEIDAVRVPLESYLEGHKTGDAKYMKVAMHTEGKLMYIRDGKLITILFPDYVKRMKVTTFKDEDERERYIESIAVTGNIAVAKLIIKYPTIHFTDYMTLLKFNGKWKIVNKIAYSVIKGKEDDNKTSSTKSEMEAVKIPLENYLMNDKTDDPEYANKAFHTEGKLIWVSKGKFTTLDFKDFIAGMDGKTSGNESGKSRWIESIDITGNIATAKVILDNPRVRVYDFFSLMKIDGDWKIVSKSYTFERK